jgi:hypothetical protein
VAAHTITEGIEKRTLAWVDFVPDLQEIQNLETQRYAQVAGLGGPKNETFDSPVTQSVRFGPKRGPSPACAGALLLHDADAAIAARGGGHADLGVPVV